MERYSDKAIDIINDLHTERLDYESEYIPLIDCANQCAAYENTGLTPEEIKELLHDTTGPLHHKLGEWIDADTSGRLVVLPHDAKDAVYGGYISDVKGTYLEVAKELLAEQVAQCVKLAMLDKDMFVVDGDTVRWKLWIFPEEALRRAENGNC